ncbi:hypothetical protein HDU67_004805 [Dinochytrium kinnereticum]|nr:hypothetical protein HDU67_004805 [Dinochytrium kinnereticum]
MVVRRLACFRLLYAQESKAFFTEAMPSALENYISNITFAMRMKSINERLAKFQTIRDYFPALRLSLATVAIIIVITAALLKVGEVPIPRPVWLIILSTPLIVTIAYFVVFFKSQTKFKPLVFVEKEIKTWNAEDKEVGLTWHTKRTVTDLFDSFNTGSNPSDPPQTLTSMFCSILGPREPVWDIWVVWRGTREEAAALDNHDPTVLPEVMALPQYEEEWTGPPPFLPVTGTSPTMDLEQGQCHPQHRPRSRLAAFLGNLRPGSPSSLHVDEEGGRDGVESVEIVVHVTPSRWSPRRLLMMIAAVDIPLSEKSFRNSCWFLFRAESSSAEPVLNASIHGFRKVPSALFVALRPELDGAEDPSKDLWSNVEEAATKQLKYTRVEGRAAI